jgi:methylenetetrahydrofolate reductase (NADPH)
VEKHADFLFAPVSFSIDELLEWRSSVDFAGPIYAGVLVVASAAMARKLSTDVPQLAVPEQVMDVIERDPSAGVDVACDLVAEVHESGAFDGVHLIPIRRYREVASRLEARR